MVKLLKKLEKIGKEIKNKQAVQKTQEKITSFNKGFEQQIKFAKFVVKKPKQALKAAVDAVSSLHRETCDLAIRTPRPTL